MQDYVASFTVYFVVGQSSDDDADAAVTTAASRFITNVDRIIAALRARIIWRNAPCNGGAGTARRFCHQNELLITSILYRCCGHWIDVVVGRNEVRPDMTTTTPG